MSAKNAAKKTPPAQIQDVGGSPTAYTQRLASVTRAEYDTYRNFSESDSVLNRRIQQYCADLGFDVPSATTIAHDGFHWSATFISWCVKNAGATAEEFKFSVRHSEFVHAAIANALGGQGVFRGHPIESYVPKIGDIVQNNRGGTNYTYDHARQNTNYPSHSAIVVDFVEEGNERFAVTIGGNEGDTVGRKRIRLHPTGHIKQRSPDPYICVIETLKTGEFQGVVDLAGAGQSLPASFRKHGTFIYRAAETVNSYGSIDLTVAAMQRAGMTHAWVRIHGTSAYSGASKQSTRNLIAGLRDGGIAVAGWGWCQGSSPVGDAALALQESAAYGLIDYIADIEEGVNDSHWTRQEVETFCQAIRADLPGSFGVTTFGLIDYHAPELMKAALPFVHFFNPQVYWFSHPNTTMVNRFRKPDGSRYERNNPGEYMDLCIDRWNAMMGNDPRPLVVSGQAYWGEGSTQTQSDAKMEEFLNNWNGYPRVAGINWWHMGRDAAMSHAMLERITSANLGQKPYADPA